MTATGDRWSLPDWQRTLAWCAERNSQKIRCIVDVLGEYATDDGQASRLVEAYEGCIQDIGTRKLRASITLKLTALGGLHNLPLCQDRVLDLCNTAKTAGVRVEIDMEGIPLVDAVIETAMRCAEEGYFITLALQAYLDRTVSDLQEALSHKIRVRLVKGAYFGDTDNFLEIQERFRNLAVTLIDSHTPFAVGTHDPDLIAFVMGQLVGKQQLVEFGFLKGLSDKTKMKLAGEGWAVAEYVPFGERIAVYEARRLKYLGDLSRIGRSPAP
jgi:proline dehydrogenase